MTKIDDKTMKRENARVKRNIRLTSLRNVFLVVTLLARQSTTVPAKLPPVCRWPACKQSSASFYTDDQDSEALKSCWSESCVFVFDNLFESTTNMALKTNLTQLTARRSAFGE
jgi:hypothetical protein